MKLNILDLWILEGAVYSAIERFKKAKEEAEKEHDNALIRGLDRQILSYQAVLTKLETAEMGGEK